MRRGISYPVLVALVVLLALASSVVVVEVRSFPFTGFTSVDITFEPRVPNSSEDVEVTVSLGFDSFPPFAQDFGTPVQTGDTFSANVTIYAPGPDWIGDILPMPHTDSYTYYLSNVAVGGYVFRVHFYILYMPAGWEMEYGGDQVLFTVTFLGDVDHDYDVDIFDVVFCAFAYGSTPSSPDWNPYCDIAEPHGKIDIFDLVTVASNYGQQYSP